MIAATTAQFKAEQAALRKEYLEIIVSQEHNPEYWLPRYDKSAGHFARLSNGEIVVIDKPSIQTRFCFGESGYDYDEAFQASVHAAHSEEYFKQENLSDFQRWIDRLEGNSSRPCSVYTISAGNGIACLTWGHPYDCVSADFHPLSEADRAILLATYRAAYAAFEKRLNAYLKRYGLSKVQTWTYWRDA